METIAWLAFLALLIFFGVRRWWFPKGPPIEYPESMVALRRTYEREIEAIERELMAYFETLGIWRLEPPEVASDPALLEDCARFERATAIVDAWRDKMDKRHAQFEHDIAELPVDEQIKAEVVEGLAQARGRGLAFLAIRTELMKSQLAVAGRKCRVLARRNWELRCGEFDFHSEGDSVEYRDTVHAWDDLGSRFRRALQQVERGRRSR